VRVNGKKSTKTFDEEEDAVKYIKDWNLIHS
jgi:hypothetical protein